MLLNEKLYRLLHFYEFFVIRIFIESSWMNALLYSVIMGLEPRVIPVLELRSLLRSTFQNHLFEISEINLHDIQT